MTEEIKIINTWLQQAYDAGRAARCAGLHNTDNPYSDLVDQEIFDEWCNGYWDADWELTDKVNGECAS